MFEVYEGYEVYEVYEVYEGYEVKADICSAIWENLILYCPKFSAFVVAVLN